MQLLQQLFRRPEPQPLRFVVATRRENEEARRRRTEIACQLAVYNAVTSPEQRRAETDAYIAAARRTARLKREMGL